MGSFVTLHQLSLKYLMEACHNCPKCMPADVTIGNISEIPGKVPAVHTFSFACCESVITTDGAILWHSEDIDLEAIAGRTQSSLQPAQVTQDASDVDEDQDNFVDMRIKLESTIAAKTDIDEDDASCRVVSERDPLLLDELAGVQTHDSDCSGEEKEKVEVCDVKAVSKSLRKNLLGILNQQDSLGVNITSEENKVGCSKGRKYPTTFICEFCGKVFTGKERAYQFYYHKNREHTHKTIFKCDICSKEFWGDRELLAHRGQHKDQGHVCHICGKNFKYAKNLQVHLTVHVPTREHVCQYCDKAFRRKDHLTVHERIHTGATPYQCPWCDSGYPQKHQLNRHMRKCPLLKKNDTKICAT